MGDLFGVPIEEYEKSCQLLLAKIRKPIERALNDVAIKVKEIDEIILVGGATKLSQGAMKERNETIKEIILTDVCPYNLGTNVSVQ